MSVPIDTTLLAVEFVVPAVLVLVVVLVLLFVVVLVALLVVVLVVLVPKGELELLASVT